MLLLEARKIKKTFQTRTVLDIDEFFVYEGDRIGVVGLNGEGKTTFFNILAGEMESDGGIITPRCEISYLKQFGEREEADYRHLSEMNVKQQASQVTVSGGEDTRLRFAAALSKSYHLILMDEPTSNLDADGIQLVCEKIKKMRSFLLISHDRYLLDETCNKIIELKDGKITWYTGNYSDYKEVSKLHFQRDTHAYENYRNEKKRLEQVHQQKLEQAQQVTKRPKSISKHEYRMNNFYSSKSSAVKQRRLFQNAKAVSKRIENLDVHEKPEELAKIKMDFNLTNPPKNKVIIEGKQVQFGYRDMLFEEANFYVEKGEHIAITGGNGVGKTTLVHLIAQKSQGIKLVPKATLGILSQNAQDLDDQNTILEEVQKDSVQNETFVRTVLSRLLFPRDELKKKVGVLSGGERIKLQMAKLFVSAANVLILDEPTNYLDIPSIEQLQILLKDYEGTILFISHDAYFVNEVATHILAIQDKKIYKTEGNLENVVSKSKKQETIKGLEKTRLEMSLSTLSIKLLAGDANREELEREYAEITKKLKDLNK